MVTPVALMLGRQVVRALVVTVGVVSCPDSRGACLSVTFQRYSFTWVAVKSTHPVVEQPQPAVFPASFTATVWTERDPDWSTRHNRDRPAVPPDLHYGNTVFPFLLSGHGQLLALFRAAWYRHECDRTGLYQRASRTWACDLVIVQTIWLLPLQVFFINHCRDQETQYTSIGFGLRCR